MIQLELGIRYLSQLKRTRPNEMGRLESGVASLLKESGGAARKDGNLLIVEFDERVLAFWLDIAIALEGISDALGLADKDLLGRSCVLRSFAAGCVDGHVLCRRLSACDNPSGVWCDALVATSLREYATFRPEGDWFALESFTFRARAVRGDLDFRCRGDLAAAVASFGLSNPSKRKGVYTVEGPARSGKSLAVRAALGSIASSVAVFRVSFDGNGRGLPSVADALAEERWREIAAANAVEERALRARSGPAEFLKAGRLSLGIAAAPRKAFGDFFSDFVSAWIDAVAASRVPVLVVENAHLADDAAVQLLKRAFGARVDDGRAHLLLCGTGSSAMSRIGGIPCRRATAAVPEKRELNAAVASLRGAWGLPAADERQLDECFLQATENGIRSAYRAAVGWSLRADGVPRAAHPHLSGDLLEIAYALWLSNALFAPGALAETFAALRKPRAALSLALSRLAELGVVDDASNPRIDIPEFASFAEASLGARAQVVRGVIRDRLLASVLSKRIANSYESAARFVELGGESDADRLLDAIVDGIIRGETEAVSRALADGSFSSVAGSDRADALAFIFRTRNALMTGDEAEARAVFSAPQPERFPNPRYRAYALLDRASFAFSADQLDSAALSLAAADAKNALLLLQGNQSDRGLSRAYRLLGETELARSRIAEAVDYFGFAAESAERSGERYEALLSAVNGACTQFLIGNLSKAERCAVEAEQRAGDIYQNGWRSWARFMQGRVRFSIGRYDSAAETFASLTDEEESASLFKNWRDRALSFGDSSIGASFLEHSGDRDFFLVEAAFIQGAYAEAVQRADLYLSSIEAPRFRNAERLDWSSGFAQIEDRAIGRDGGDRVCRRLARVYRAFSLANSGRAEEAVSDLHLLAKEEPISELDPYDAFYFWALASALKASGTPTVDWSTVLSIAFKRLQRRASRIDDAETKRSFISANRWNGALYADAKSINLI